MQPFSSLSTLRSSHSFMVCTAATFELCLLPEVFAFYSDMRNSNFEISCPLSCFILLVSAYATATRQLSPLTSSENLDSLYCDRKGKKTQNDETLKTLLVLSFLSSFGDCFAHFPASRLQHTIFRPHILSMFPGFVHECTLGNAVPRPVCAGRSFLPLHSEEKMICTKLRGKVA